MRALPLTAAFSFLVSALACGDDGAAPGAPSNAAGAGGAGAKSGGGATARAGTGGATAHSAGTGGIPSGAGTGGGHPIFSPGSSDVGAQGFVDLKADMAKELEKASVSGKSWNVTETGAPSKVIGSSPGGVAYARSYLAKVMVTAQAQGIGGVDWFLLADTTKDADAFARMGLYEPIAGLGKVDDAKITPTGRAYQTLSQTLGTARYDAAATAALGVPAGDVVAYAFTGSGPRKVVAWAKTKATEEASGTVVFPAKGTVQRFAWDGPTETIAPTSGKISAPVDGSPIILVGD